MKKVLVIVGPTAVGKSAFGVSIAKRFNGEIISGDSIQVYKGLDIGSGKVTQEEMQGIKHYGIDVLDPKDSYSVYDFQKLSREYIDIITDLQKLPIIVGGTGLYIKSSLYDYSFNEEKKDYDTSFYDKLDNDALYEMLKEKDYNATLSIHKNNRKRVIRALAIADNETKTKSKNIDEQKHVMLYDALIIGLTVNREELYQRINNRVIGMMNQGLENEIRGLIAQNVSFDDRSMQGIGYKEFKEYLNGDCKIDDVVKLIQQHSRQFAKRQYTWFNNQMPIQWFDVDSELDKAMELIEKWKNH